MDIRDTVSRVLLGIAFGFVMGIVMYQAAGIDAGVLDKNVLNAQQNTSTGYVGCVGAGNMPGPGGCCPGYVPGSDGVCWPPCTGTNMGAGCSSASPPSMYLIRCFASGGGGSCFEDPAGSMDQATCLGTIATACPIPSSSPPACAPPSTNCGNLGCCTPGQGCDTSTNPDGICTAPVSSSSPSSAPFCTTPPLTNLCGPGLCCDASQTCGMVGGIPGCVGGSSSGGSSSGGCCNTATNSCQS